MFREPSRTASTSTVDVRGTSPQTHAGHNAVPELQALKDERELRWAALGPDHYEALTLDEQRLQDVQRELHLALRYESLTLATTVRKLALEDQRRRVADHHEQWAAERQQAATRAHEIKQKALAAFQHHAEVVANDRDVQFDEDKRRLLQREKDLLLRRRREFELGQASKETVGATRDFERSQGRPGAGTRRPVDGNPVLAFDVTLGNGKSVRVMVRDTDDPNGVAKNLARQHGLRPDAVEALASQIHGQLSTVKSRRARSPAASSIARSAQRARTPTGTLGGRRAVSPASTVRARANTPRAAFR